MEILSIKLSKKSANVFNCMTSEGEFALHSDVIVKLSIKVGECEDDLFYKAVRESSELIGYNLVLKYIGANVKTEKQIRDYLFRKEYDGEIIDSIIAKLKDYKIIDDKAYADMYVRSNPNFSKNKLKQKLYSNGVKTDIVDDSVEFIDDTESAIRHAEKFIRTKELSKENVDKLIRRLNYLGYSWDTIKTVLNKLKCDMEEV